MLPLISGQDLSGFENLTGVKKANNIRKKVCDNKKVQLQIPAYTGMRRFANKFQNGYLEATSCGEEFCKFEFNNNFMNGTCRLFGTQESLRKSHIYPAFVIDYFKKTGSKFLRRPKEPNVRLQDGLKIYLLSDKAEQRFSTSEKWFSEKIFIPYLEQNARAFNYDENLFYFCISFLWRILVLNLDFTPESKGKWFSSKLLEVENEWRDFLANYKFPQNFNNIQLLFTDRVKNCSADAKGFDYYTSRALDGTIITNEKESYLAIYAKLLRFIFWIVIKTDMPYSNKDLLINPLKGELKIPQRIEDDYFGGFLINRANEFEKLQKPSENQQQKILQELLKNPEEFLNSDLGKS